MPITQAAVGPLLVLQVVEALCHRQVLLVVFDGLLVVAQGVIAVAQVPVGPAPVQRRLRGAQLLQCGQLLLEEAQRLLHHPHVHLGDAHVPVNAGLRRRLLQENMRVSVTFHSEPLQSASKVLPTTFQKYTEDGLDGALTLTQQPGLTDRRYTRAKASLTYKAQSYILLYN